MFLTAAQSLFAVAILISLSMGRGEALLLGGLFLSQFFITDETVRLVYAVVYSVLAVLVLARDVPRFPRFAGAVKDCVVAPRGGRDYEG